MIKLDHVTIMVRDYRRSRDWYIETLGLREEFEVPGRASALQDDAGFTLFLEQAPPRDLQPGCILYFQVPDVEAKHRQLVAAGVESSHPPEKRFWGYGAELKDPDDYRLRLWDENTMREKGGA